VTLHYAGCDAAPDGPALLDRLIAAPFLPFGPADFRADLTHAALPAPGSFMLGPDCAVETLRVNHPGGSLALKTRAGGRSFVYVPDFEHDDGPLDAALVAFLEGVDLAVLDCTFSPSEYPRMRGLGHSHWGRVAELVEAAGVAHWGAFHHAHTRTDEELDLLAQSLLRSGGGGFVVVEGMTFDLMAPGLAMGWPAPRAPA
jgi:phosphoribosyl 1,2-cyclic phosphodiesterase